MPLFSHLNNSVQCNKGEFVAKFNIEDLILDQNEACEKIELSASIPVMKKPKQDFFRVHPDPSYRISTNLIEDASTGVFYMIEKSLWSMDEVNREFKSRQLITAMTDESALFIMVAPTSGESGYPYDHLKAVRKALEGWVRLKQNKSKTGYDILSATNLHLEPNWPEAPFLELLESAFANHYIDSLDHQILKKLRGDNGIE